MEKGHVKNGEFSGNRGKTCLHHMLTDFWNQANKTNLYSGKQYVLLQGYVHVHVAPYTYLSVLISTVLPVHTVTGKFENAKIRMRPSHCSAPGGTENDMKTIQICLSLNLGMFAPTSLVSARL